MHIATMYRCTKNVYVCEVGRLVVGRSKPSKHTFRYLYNQSTYVLVAFWGLPY
jgi:hypothetical protein